MKCPICNGKGTQFIADYDGMYDIVCDKCKGKGELDENGNPILTNEEWLRSCPPQELIRFLMNAAYGGQIRSVQKRTFDEEAEKWSKWLKEKHTE